MLASSVGQALTKHMHELLDLMIAYGLSEPLHKALNDLGRHIPQLLPTIQGESSHFHRIQVPQLMKRRKN
jgi:FKBP12-rapamycin complex-associated protein